MKTVFIINPAAGQGENTEKLVESITKSSENAAYYITKSVSDATRYVREYCKMNGPARFIACGGDGTLNEVLNGAVEFEGAEVGVIPVGTGNDFCRNFNSDFFDVSGQINGKTQKCDVIKYTTEINGVKKYGYTVNMSNIGFDCNVVDMTAKMKKKPFISGPFAYFISIFAMLVKKKGAALKIEADGKEQHNGELLLTSIANGSYCGGGLKSNPLSSVNDGFINMNIVKNLSRCRFITLLPRYMNGTFLTLKKREKYISSIKCKRVTITPLTEKMRLCCDGEIADAGKTEFEIIPHAFDFVIPEKIKQPVSV